MRHVNIKQLRFFLLLMEYRDFGAVAACAQVRIPTVAYNLKGLREITADPLFVKRYGRLEPTPGAIRLEKTARQLLDKWIGMVQSDDCNAISFFPGRQYSIGFSSSIGDAAVTETVGSLCRRFPQHSFIARPVADKAALLEFFDTGDVDCAFVVDGDEAPHGVVSTSVMATPRWLISAKSNTKSVHWILLHEDREHGNPLFPFLANQALMPGHRETVVSSWNLQISLLHSAGGTCPVLGFNLPLVTSKGLTRVLEPATNFPAWAALHFWTRPRNTDGVVVREILDIGTSVLRNALKAFDGHRFITPQATQQALAIVWPPQGQIR